MQQRNMLYPLMVLAAFSVILFSVVGIATMTGRVSDARSAGTPAMTAPAQEAQGRVGKEAEAVEAGRPVRSAAATTCGNCGVVESVRTIEHKGQGSGGGAVAGGVVGALVGNQFGHGGGRAATTVLGAAGGAYVGNEIEKSTKKYVTYRITVRMDDGTARVFNQRSVPSHSAGEKVKIVNGKIVERG